MTLTIIGNEISLPESRMRTVVSLLEEMDVAQRFYANVELKGEILEREFFDSTPVAGGDVIEFVYFMGRGGRKC